MNRSIFQDARFQPTPDQADQARIADAMFDKPEDPIMIETPEERPDVGVQNEAHLLAVDPHAESVHCTMALRPGRNP